MTTNNENEQAHSDRLVEEAKQAKRRAEALANRYQRIREVVEREKERNHIFALMMRTLGG